MKRLFLLSVIVAVVAACSTKTYRLTPGSSPMPISKEEFQRSLESEPAKRDATEAQGDSRQAQGEGEEAQGIVGGGQGDTPQPQADPHAAQSEQPPAAGNGDQAPAPRREPLAASLFLAAGPLPLPCRAFDESSEDDIADLLGCEHIEAGAWPAAGDVQPWLPGTDLEWRQQAAEDGAVRLARGAAAETEIFFLAAYLSASRWQKVAFEVKGRQPFVLYVDGDEQARSLDRPAAGDEPAAAKATCSLTRGKHLLLVKALALPGDGQTSVEISASVEGIPATVELSIAADRTFTDMNTARRLASFDSFAISPDGRILAAAVTETPRGLEKGIKSLRLFDGTSGAPLDVFDTVKGASSLSWSPDGVFLAYKSGGDLFRLEVATRRIAPVIEGVEGLGKFLWSPDSRFIYFSRTGAGPEKKEKEYVRLEGIHGRLTDYSEDKVLAVAPAGGGVQHRLTETGSFALEDFALSPDGGRLALVKRFPIPERPYFRTEFWLLFVPEGKAERLLETAFPFENVPSHLAWSPDGRRIAFIGPPDQVGPNARSAAEHNYFESDLWLIDIESRSLSRISDRFDAAVEGPLFWHPADGCIYFRALHRTATHLARVAVDGDSGIELLHGAPAVASAFAAAAEGGRFAFAGSSLDQAEALYTLEPGNREPRAVFDPNREVMKSMQLGAWERFDFTSSFGHAVDGFLFYPPGFETGRTYPLIVYYYGGATPETERFSVTYTHFLPANGYLVYMLNPAGAAGYGEALADAHVNDWGAVAAAEIIEGTEKLLAAKDFIDRQNIGCYGGSYGGFMTLSLVTKTNLFKAACALYGISNLASYWGAGVWGYTYGDTAMAGSFPWNRPEFFVDRSPLFHADRVAAALLLMHGTDDVNVPVAESEQMFTALQVLGKEVAYLRFPGEDHGIGGSRETYILHRRVMLEWFDKHLKGEPEAWEARWR